MGALSDPAFWSGFSTGVGCFVALGVLFVNRQRIQRMVPFHNFSRGLISIADKVASRDMKLVLVVRMDCKMEKGKIAAQCSHAAVMAYKQCQEVQPEALARWEFHGQPKIVCKVNSEEEMIAIAHKAQELGLLTSVVRDAGRTQVVPGTKTVLGIGPGPVNLIDECSKHLKLL